MNDTGSAPSKHSTVLVDDRSSGARRYQLLNKVIVPMSLTLISTVALWLRWQRLYLAEFTEDQAWVLNSAVDFASGGPLPLRGVTTSMGAIQGPWEVYLLALPALVSSDPLVASAFVGLLQVAAILGTYLLTSRYFGRWAGLVAAGLFAVNPWAVQYSRKIWTPDWLPFFSVALLASLVGLLAERRRWLAALALPLQAIMVLIHPSAILFAPVVGMTLIWRWREVLWAPALAGGALALLASAPYLVYEYGRQFYSFSRYFGASTAAAIVDAEAAKVVGVMASAKYFPTMMGYGFRGSWTLPTLSFQDWLSIGLLVFGLGACLALATRGIVRREVGPRWQAGLLAALWLIVPVVASLRHSLAVHPHYFVGVYPAQFILMAAGLATAGALATATLRPHTTHARAIMGSLGLGVALFIALPQVDLVNRYLDLVEKNGPTRLYGVPLRYTQAGVAAARAAASQYPGAPVYIFSYKQRDVVNYLARDIEGVRSIDPPEGLVLPSDPSKGALYLLSSDDGNTADKAYRLVADNGPLITRMSEYGFVEDTARQVRAPDGYVYYRLFYASPEAITKILSGFAPSDHEARLANGMTLRGQRFPASAVPGEKVELTTLWAVPNADKVHFDQEHNVFVHLIDHAGREVAQRDVPLAPYRIWRESDLFVAYSDLTVPDNWGPGLLWFDIGAYARYERSEVPWLDSAGRPGRTARKVGPVAVRPNPSTAALTGSTMLEYGPSIQLVGYQLPATPGRPGTNLNLRLRWSVTTAPSADYTVSVQLLDAAGQLVAQHDGMPVNGAYPTTHWQAGDVVDDEHDLQLPAHTKPGDYSLTVILYDKVTQQRLPVSDANGTSLGDYARVATVAVD